MDLHSKVPKKTLPLRLDYKASERDSIAAHMNGTIVLLAFPA